MRGSSGAVITVHATHVVKQGNERVGRQGRWLNDHAAPSLPVVYGVSDDRYMMERLVSLDLDLLDSVRVAKRVELLLKRDVWSKPAECNYDSFAHLVRIEPLWDLVDSNIERWVRDLRRNVKWSALTKCLTHGDPITDNLMMRSTPDGRAELVIIDPIPATGAIPDVKAVDIGRLLQSAAGYEVQRYGDGPEPCLDMIGPMLCSQLSDEDALASCYFAVVHTMRSLVYVDARTKQSIHDVVLNRLINYAQGWM